MNPNLLSPIKYSKALFCICHGSLCSYATGSIECMEKICTILIQSSQYVFLAQSSQVDLINITYYCKSGNYKKLPFTTYNLFKYLYDLDNQKENLIKITYSNRSPIYNILVHAI